MRKLVVVRGASGSGKSTFLTRDLGLEGHVLSADAIRMLVAGTTMNGSGRMMVDQAQNDRVIGMLKDLLARRMERGDTLALDMVQEGPGDARFALDLAREHAYEVLVVEFADVPVEVALSRNAARAEHLRVPEATVRRQHAGVAATPMADAASVGHRRTVVRWSPDGSHVARARDWLAVPMLDLSAYERVVHVGDLQGCHTVLAGPGGPLEGGLRDDAFHVFAGDWLDRGIENGRLMRWVLDHVAGRPNVAVVEGNHERHLRLWAAGRPPVSDEFRDRTLPQLLAAGITPDDAARVVADLRECVLYDWRGQRVMVTHGGLANLPERPEMISTAQYVHGTGFYDDPVDRRFSENAPEGWVQLHGHRNPRGHEADAFPRSFSLEDRVEFGGNLRVATLDASGWSFGSYPNKVFVKEAPRARDHGVTPDWMLRADRAPTTLPPEDVAALRDHAGVRCQPAAAATPHVVSYSFTKEVFYDKSWDDVVVKARGLFVDSADATVVSRSYDKFFNVGERPETELDNLSSTLKFPIKAYDKENGFLGILGYDAREDKLFVSSKSKAEGPFAEMFRTILHDTVTPSARERIKRFLRDNEASMAFEVIDPVGDPHMIPYDRAHLVLLDVFHRSATGERMAHEKLVKVAASFGLQAKERIATFKDMASFRGFHARTESMDFRIKGRATEGFVIEDASGAQVKIKTAYYAFWKQMRSQIERLTKQRSRNLPWKPYRIEESRDPELARDFLAWAVDQDDAVLKGSIIQLRDAYEAHVAANALEASTQPMM